MNRTHSSWSEGGVGCSCTISTHLPTTFRGLVEDDFDGAGTYNVGIQRETYPQEEYQFYAISVEELMNFVQEMVKKSHLDVDIRDDLDIMEHVDYIEKISEVEL